MFSCVVAGRALLLLCAREVARDGTALRGVAAARCRPLRTGNESQLPRLVSICSPQVAGLGFRATHSGPAPLDSSGTARLHFRIVILEFSAEKGGWERVHCETFGKSGVRRIVPGQYVATDPRGRAVSNLQ